MRRTWLALLPLLLNTLLTACATEHHLPPPDVGQVVALPCPLPPPRPTLPPVPSYSFQTRLQAIFDSSLLTPTTSATPTGSASKP